jgi:two-component system phosphate regulon response regulator PhoB
MAPAEEPILVIDDEPDIRDLEALERLRGTRPALVVLDAMLPDLSGTEVLRIVRQGAAGPRALPVILLTARSEEVDRVVGFELGADAYVTKPLGPRELVLRVKAILCRRDGESGEPDQLVRGTIRLDLARHACFVGDAPVELTAKEFGVLRMLMERPGRVFSRSQLLDRVWGPGIHVTPRTVDTHIKRLREKLGPEGARISTVRGVGYRLDA